MMNDRFKFRVWNVKLNKYHIVFSMTGMVNDTLAGYAKDNNFILEQCTGLKDKNSKLIYEGDILSLYKLKNPIVVICKWNIDKWMFVDTSGCIRNDYHMEIIGNIHTNPELLEQSNE